MRVLLFGAEAKFGCGYFIGQRLLAMGHKVTALTLSERVAFECGVTWITGDLDAARVQREVSRADAVIDAQKPVVVRSKNVRVASLRPYLLLRALEGTGKRLVVTSTAAVLGETGTTPLDETARAQPQRNYAWLARLEKKRLSANGVQPIVVRPSTVHGLLPIVASLTAWLLLARRRRRGTYIEPGTNRSSAIYRDDLAELYCLALLKAEAGRDPWRQRDLLDERTGGGHSPGAGEERRGVGHCTRRGDADPAIRRGALPQYGGFGRDGQEDTRMEARRPILS
jgi:nucleoside-diphosphate-sugar epimerase